MDVDGLFGIFLHVILWVMVLRGENRDSNRRWRDVEHLERTLTFTEEISRTYRIAGTEVCAKVADRIFEEIKAISVRDDVVLEVERMKSDAGGYCFMRTPTSSRKMMMSYSSVDNVVARVTPRSFSSDADALIINSHFDSEPGSYGAADCAAPTSAMLEVLRSLAGSQTSSMLLTRPVIFLFNGAEELRLLGSHAFIHQHPWMKSVKVLLNLESAGFSSRVMLFRTAPFDMWLVKAYARAVSAPHGSVCAQDYMEAGLIPALTDHGMFWSEANVSGLDLASYRNGFLYHTDKDAVSRKQSVE